VLLGRTLGHEQSAVARSAAQHCRWRWLVASLFVVAYSWLISMFLPYFSSLVGIVASSTYLVGTHRVQLQQSFKGPSLS
jgi:vesicular inhibitory amino acid transporter